MELDIMGLIGAFSYALDCVEAELVQVTTGHSKRVAYMSVRMAIQMGIQGNELQALAACALLHDNALTQYIRAEYANNLMPGEIPDITSKQLGVHCIYGEKNLENFPFITNVKNVILYHHENADGTGPFGKKWDEVPLFARIIHLCDILDAFCKTKQFDEQKWNQAKGYVLKNKITKFDAECVEAFLNVFSEEEFIRLGDSNLEARLWELVPRQKHFYNVQDCKNLADLFATIVDYKSKFTAAHSRGVAAGAARLAEHMGFDVLTVQKMYLAGALHDIGKMAIENEILEKPGRLTKEEFSSMKNHAAFTYLILSDVEDFEEIRDWAAFHHERLDGSGYPFGKKADELNTQERMMACVDIYQALTEDRPYKKGMTHEEACAIMQDMVEKGWIDGAITKEIRDMNTSQEHVKCVLL